MKKIKTMFFVLLTSMSVSYVHAQYEIKKHTINNSGGTQSGGSFELSSSVGQLDANTNQSGGQYTLKGGYWQENNDLIFKNNLD